MRSVHFTSTLLVFSALGIGQSFTGNLDPNNPNDVLLIAFTLNAPTSLHVQSWGYGGSSGAPGGKNAAGTVITPGGFDPYITLFAGIGPAATFVASNDDGVCPPGTPTNSQCLDPTLHVNNLPAGSYMLALSVFDNFSFAENLGIGTAGDLFIGLGNYYDVISGTLRTSKYAIDITAAGLSVVSTQQLGVVAPPIISKAFKPDSIALGGTASLVFTVEDPNLLIPLTISVTDPLPAGLVVATPAGVSGPFCSSPGGASGTIAATPGANLISWLGAVIPANASCIFSVNVRGTAIGLLTNVTDNVTSIEGGAGNRAEASIVVGDPLRLRYTSNLNTGDSVINITNTGARGAALASGTSASVTGALCVNVYAFSPDEQLISCCSCPVTPNGLVSLSARNDLISNTLTPAVPTAVTVKLLASIPVAGSCSGSAARPGALTSGMEAFGTTIHAVPGTGSYAVTETPFVSATLSPAELTRLAQLCTFINANGSGFGICRSCRLGGLGADRQ